MEPIAAIPEHIEPVAPAESARLLEKQWRARIWVMSNPMAKAMHWRFRAHLKRAAKVVPL